jgi:hypothetical protein
LLFPIGLLGLLTVPTSCLVFWEKNSAGPENSSAVSLIITAGWEYFLLELSHNRGFIWRQKLLILVDQPGSFVVLSTWNSSIRCILQEQTVSY